jgi:hypothetical protein
MIWRDILGKKFRVGDRIAYPSNSGGGLKLQQAVISEPPGTQVISKKGIVAILKNGVRVVVRPQNCVILSRLEVD